MDRPPLKRDVKKWETKHLRHIEPNASCPLCMDYGIEAENRRLRALQAKPGPAIKETP